MDKDKKILFIISMFLFVALFSLSTFLVSYNSKKLMGNVLQENENNEIKYIEKEHDLSFESSVANYFTASEYSEVVDVEDGYVVLYNSLRKLVKYDFKGNLVWYVSLPYLQEEKLVKDNVQHFTNSYDKNSFVVFGSMTTKAYDKEYDLEYDSNSSYIFEIKVNETKIDETTKEYIISNEDILFSKIIVNKIFQNSNTSLIKNSDNIILSTRDSKFLEFYKYDINTKDFSQVVFGESKTSIPIGVFTDIKKWFNPVIDSKGNIIFVTDQNKTKDKNGKFNNTFRVFKINTTDGSTVSRDYSYNKEKTYSQENLMKDFNEEQYIVKDFYLNNEDDVIILLSTNESVELNNELKSKIVKITPGEKNIKEEIIINENNSVYNNIFQTEDNCFITAGYYYTDIENKNYSFIFSKYDNNGKLLWSKIDKEEEKIKGKISSSFLSKNERIIFVGSYSDVKKFFVTYANDYEITLKDEYDSIILNKNTGKVDDIIGLSFNTSSSNDVVNIIFINAYNNEEVDMEYNMDDNSFVMPSYDIIIEPVVVEKTTSPTVKPTISSAASSTKKSTTQSETTKNITSSKTINSNTTSKTTGTSSVKTTNKITSNITQNTSVSSSKVTVTTTTTKTTTYDVATSMIKEDSSDEKVTTSMQSTKVNSVKKDNKNYTNVVIYMLVGLFGVVIITTIYLYIKYKK